MGFQVIKGSFHVKQYSPDGDSIRFKPENAADLLRLKGPRAEVNARGHVQLRLEAIDTLETHYKGLHQPLKYAEGAMRSLLKHLHISGVEWNDNHTKVIEANDATKGFILAREVEKNRRPIAFAFYGAPPTDEVELYLGKDLLEESVNFKLVKEGWAYPTFYQGIFHDLRRHIAASAETARSSKKNLWSTEDSRRGFRVPSLDVLCEEHVVMPKLFRRLSAYLEGGGDVSGFVAYLEENPERVLDLKEYNFTHFDNLVEVEGDIVRLLRDPEDMVFMS